jgi:hypothetical protein
MKRILMLALLIAICRPAYAAHAAEEKLYGYAGEIRKDTCFNCGADWAAAVEKFGGQEQAVTTCKEMDAQYAAYKAAKAADDLSAAAKLTPFKWVEAWQYNNLAHRICVALKAGIKEAVEAAPKGTKAQARLDYCKSQAEKAKEALALLTSAETALDTAKLCATSNLSTAQIQEQVESCRGKVESNKDLLEKVAGTKDWE